VGAEVVQVALATLRDVTGTAGSFLMTDSGRVVARDLPAVFDDGVLAEVGSRLARLRDTFAAVGDDVEVAVLRFEEHKLYLKILPGGALCVLTAAGVSMPALRMATNLVGRRVGPDLERAAVEPVPVPVPVPVAAPGPAVASSPVPTPQSAPSPVASATATGNHVRRYRGRIVE
jgi:hypothetical protein